MSRSALFLFACLVLCALGYTVEAAPLPQATTYKILLRSRQFTPERGIESSARTRVQATSRAHHVLLQLDTIPGEAEKEALAASGVRLLHYLPDHAWFASVDLTAASRLSSIAALRWLGEIQPADKLPLTLANNQPLAYAVKGGFVALRVVYFDDVAEGDARDAIARHSGIITQSQPVFHSMTVRLPLGQVRGLADEDAISWMAEAPPPPTPANDRIRSRMRVDQVQAAPYNLNGSGVKVGIWDCTLVWPHLDFSGRLTVIGGEVTACSMPDNTQNHATHVAGILAGSGANSQAHGGTANQWRGVAPGAQLISYDFYNSTSEVYSATQSYNIDLSQNSWSFLPSGQACDLVFGNYIDLARDYDQIVTGIDGKRIPVVFAAGNAQGQCGTWNSITPPATAKNVIAVGATNAVDDNMTAFSSWGPTDDGRTKPDVVAPGYRDDFPGTDSDCALSAVLSGIRSTCPNNGYGMDFGTSMAAPAVSGMLSLMLQQYRQSPCASTILPSTLKALAIHGAIDLGNPGPDYRFGWGRVDAKNSVDLVRATRYVEAAISTGQVATYTVTITNSTNALKTTLVWDDPAAADGALVAYINDIDLTVIAPNGTVYYPWLLDPNNPAAAATTSVDRHRNNVEQVYIQSPMTGIWTVRVVGFEVPQGPQRFSIVSDALTSPVLNSVSPSIITYGSGAQIVLHGFEFAYPCNPSTIAVSLGALTITVPATNFTNDTITLTVPLTATTGSVSVTTPAGTSNALTLAVVRPVTYLPAIARDYPPEFNWLDVSDGTRIVNGDDVTQTVALPFPFTYYGGTFTRTQVSSNGFISFAPLSDSFNASSCIPSASAPNNAIYGFWSDLVPNDARPDLAAYARAVWAKQVGNNFVIEWQQVPRFGLTDVETFEIILAANNGITIQYLNVSNTNDVVVGVENASGIAAQQAYCSVSNPAPGFETGQRPANGQLFYFNVP